MTKVPKTTMLTEPRPGLLVAIADAQAAAARASAIASGAGQWAWRAGLAVDDAVEASLAAVRARHAAERAERCVEESEAWEFARLAWAAEVSAEEASARVNGAIAESLIRG
ncbi:MAG: hypothetical protein HOP12_02405 [Candidatus Eisenbacteria bacterium]|uniref:Uncharacterized protein n=1 Tax=Eiseniibacteriota bacterium TaxID=2212470 RepID=A0A849SC99_UNCEI|nr:hypothetical protein [Candidatus Eisenbacteria bacterium]